MTIQSTIQSLPINELSPDRLPLLDQLVGIIQARVAASEPVRLNFICTHNSRRSHLGQVWAQTLAAYYGVSNVACYSGGTESTALYPVIAQTLETQGFQVERLSMEPNPVYALKYAPEAVPIIGFSKAWDHPYNPQEGFVAIMTCDHADQNCPFIPGAQARIALTYEDPKVSDGTPAQAATYRARSLQIATELAYVFQKISISHD